MSFLLDGVEKEVRVTFASTIVPTGSTATYSFACVSPNDQFSKSIGRNLAQERLTTIDGTTKRSQLLIHSDRYYNFWSAIFEDAIAKKLFPKNWDILTIEFSSSRKTSNVDSILNSLNLDSANVFF